MASEKAPVRLQRFDALEFVPRFEYGEMAEVSGICGAEDGTELGIGVRARLAWELWKARKEV
jgi:hypothetical protein